MNFDKTGQDPMSDVAAEESLISAVTEMLKDKEYHFPYSKAIADCRSSLEGMTAATMQEQVFIDALDHYLANTGDESRKSLEESPKRRAGSDFKYKGQEFEHKVGRHGAIDIAAIWDATEEAAVELWTFNNPIIFSSGGYGSPRMKIAATSEERGVFNVTAFGPNPEQTLDKNHDILLVEWGTGREVEIKKHYKTEEKVEMFDFCESRGIYSDITNLIDREKIPSNHIELLEVTAANKGPFRPGLKFSLDVNQRAGIYIFRQEILEDVPLENIKTVQGKKANNKAQLVKKDQVLKFMQDSEDSGLFVPLPIWWGALAGVKTISVWKISRDGYRDYQHNRLTAR